MTALTTRLHALLIQACDRYLDIAAIPVEWMLH
jgi:hypothetical protein